MEEILHFLRITIVRINEKRKSCPYYCGPVTIAVSNVDLNPTKSIQLLTNWLLVQLSKYVKKNERKRKKKKKRK